jgi:threonine/homoserine/homoserine lactone efflux protein
MFNLAAFISYVTVVTFTPGPNNILSMTNASQYGFKKTLSYMAGAGTGVLIVISASAYFNLILFNVIPKIKAVMGIVGATYMIYLAIKIMKSKPSENKTSGDPIRFQTGIALEFVNPKFLIYAVTVTSNFIVPYFSSSYYIPFALLITTICVSSLVVWALFGTVFKRFLSRYYLPFNVAMGALLLYSAYSISGLTHLFQ